MFLLIPNVGNLDLVESKPKTSAPLHLHVSAVFSCETGSIGKKGGWKGGAGGGGEAGLIPELSFLLHVFVS